MGLFKSSSNHTCPTLSLAESTTDPVVGTWSFHHLNLVISGVATAFSCVAIVVLMTNHAIHMSKPKEQLKIMRICLLIPVYGIMCFISVIAPETYVYLHPWTDLAQAVALGNFFLLLLDLVSPHEAQRDTFFAGLEVPQKTSRKGGLSSLQDGMAWYRKICLTIFQFIPVSLLVGIFTCITQAAGKYCLTSSAPYFSHLWLNLIRIFSLASAVISVLRFYGALRSQLAGHKPLAKLLAFKLLVGLNFILQIIFWVLGAINPSPLSPTSKLSYSDVTVGIPMLVNCLLMVPFSVFFYFAYDIKPYRLSNLPDQENQRTNGATRPVQYHGGAFGIKAWCWVWSPMELILAIWLSFKMIVESKKRRANISAYVDQESVSSRELEQNTVYEGRAGGYNHAEPLINQGYNERY